MQGLLKLRRISAAVSIVWTLPSLALAQTSVDPSAPSPAVATPAQSPGSSAEPGSTAPVAAGQASPPQAPAGIDEGSSLINEDLSLAELLNMKVTLPTRIEQSADEAPSVVSVISRQDIETYGARDVADILRMVPGFEFGADVLGLVGAGQRGIWGDEGKILLMINGITFNALDYGNPNFFGTMPASMIERVEIIRGPGSAIYGTFAQAAVINVVTRDTDGVKFSANGGMMDDTPTWGAGVAATVRRDDLKISMTAGHSAEILTTRPYADFFGGETTTGRKRAPRNWYHLTVDLVYKEALKLQFVNTLFLFGNPDTLGAALEPRPYDEYSENRIHGVRGSYTGDLTERLSLEPSFEFIMATPSNGDTSPSFDNYFATPFIQLGRYRGELAAHYRIAETGHFMVGGGLQHDTASHIGPLGEPGLQLPDGSYHHKIHADSQIAYTQYLQTFGPVGVTLGGRYESTRFGDALAPRAGLVFNQHPVSVKLLYGRAFRIPLLIQAYSRIVTVAEDVRPETSDTVEIQNIYSITDNIKSRVNGFYTQVNQPITYLSDTNAYQNFGKISSMGAEVELEARYNEWGGVLNGSFARPGPGTSPGFSSADGKNFLGVPPLKFVAGGYWSFHQFRFAPSLVLLSTRYGQSQESANSLDGLLADTTYPPLLLANVAITWRDPIPGTLLQLTAHNLLNAPYVLVQPYYGAHAPLPAQDREIRLQLETSL